MTPVTFTALVDVQGGKRGKIERFENKTVETQPTPQSESLLLQNLSSENDSRSLRETTRSLYSLDSLD